MYFFPNGGNVESWLLPSVLCCYFLGQIVFCSSWNNYPSFIPLFHPISTTPLHWPCLYWISTRFLLTCLAESKEKIISPDYRFKSHCWYFWIECPVTLNSFSCCFIWKLCLGARVDLHLHSVQIQMFLLLSFSNSSILYLGFASHLSSFFQVFYVIHWIGFQYKACIS